MPPTLNLFCTFNAIKILLDCLPDYHKAINPEVQASNTGQLELDICDESDARNLKGVFRILGHMPLYDKAAARADGMSDSWIVRRANELHHIAMS